MRVSSAVLATLLLFAVGYTEAAWWPIPNGVDPQICQDVRNSHRCAILIEAALLLSRPHVTRSGEELTIESPNGARFVFENRGRFGPYYSYFGYLEQIDCELVHLQYYESSDFLLIHLPSGISVPITGHPAISPASANGVRFVAAVDSDPNHGATLEVWRFSSLGPSLEFHSPWPREFSLSHYPRDLRWESANLLSFKSGDVTFLAEHTHGKWSLEQRSSSE